MNRKWGSAHAQSYPSRYGLKMGPLLLPWSLTPQKLTIIRCPTTFSFLRNSSFPKVKTLKDLLKLYPSCDFQKGAMTRPKLTGKGDPRRAVAGIVLALLCHRRDEHGEGSWRGGQGGPSLITRCLAFLRHWLTKARCDKSVTSL